MAIIEAIETIYLEADAASVSFDSIAGYEHLQLHYSIASDTTGGDWKSILIQFNDDTGSNYHYRQMYAYSTSKSTFGSGGAETRTGWMSTLQENSSAPYSYGGGTITIADYLSANKNTSLLDVGGVNNRSGASRGIQGTSMSVWDDTAALTKITLKPQNDNWLRGTTFTLYGIKSS